MAAVEELDVSQLASNYRLGLSGKDAKDADGLATLCPGGLVNERRGGRREFLWGLT